MRMGYQNPWMFLFRAQNLTSRYEAETNIAKDIMNEDIAIATLGPDTMNLG